MMRTALRSKEQAVGDRGPQIAGQGGFTLVEVLVTSVIVLLVAAGVWGIYWSVVNTYYEEQKGVALQAEGEQILHLIADGGNFAGRRIYGLSAMAGVSGAGYPVTGTTTIPGIFTDTDDYRIGYPVDSGVSNVRYAQFYVKFDGGPTSELHFQLKTDGTGADEEHNYDALITRNLLQRKSGTDPTAFGNYDKTWFKAEPLSFVTGYCTGVKVSFYLANTSDLVTYNYRLDRQPDPPIGNEDQRRSFLNGIPYPKYFSTTVYVPSRN
jgi:prepilin-type N-terminal cleavage/methylation domain-containing protein